MPTVMKRRKAETGKVATKTVTRAPKPEVSEKPVFAPQYGMKIDIGRKILHVNVALPKVPPGLIVCDAHSTRFTLSTPRFSRNYVLDVPYVHGLTIAAKTAEAEFAGDNLHIKASIKSMPPDAEEAEKEKRDAIIRESKLRFVTKADGTRTVRERKPRNRKDADGNSAADAAAARATLVAAAKAANAAVGSDSDDNSAPDLDVADGYDGGASASRPQKRGRGAAAEADGTAAPAKRKGPAIAQDTKVTLAPPTAVRRGSQATALQAAQKTAAPAQQVSRKAFLPDDREAALSQIETSTAAAAASVAAKVDAMHSNQENNLAKASAKAQRKSAGAEKRAALAAARMSSMTQEEPKREWGTKKKKRAAEVEMLTTANRAGGTHKGPRTVSFSDATKGQRSAKKSMKKRRGGDMDD